MRPDTDHAILVDTAAGRGAVTTQDASSRDKGRTTLEQKSRLFARILVDAGRGAREYIERWVAGRGAE